MQLRRAHASGNAEPSRSRGLGRESPKSEACSKGAVAPSLAQLQGPGLGGCGRGGRCGPNNPHSIWGVIFGYRRRPVSAHRIGTTLWSLVCLIADADRLPVAAFWMCSLHQAIIGRRRSM